MRRLTAHADMQMHQGTQAASMIQDGTIDLSFLICTFHREDQLVEAMHSVLQLEGLADIRYEILVVDNSDEESARSAVEGFAASTSCAHVRYVAAHPPNISVARNAGVEAAAGTFIAMIDDDMKVRPDWLKAMLPMMRDSAFDVLCGPVEAIYADPALATRESRFFFHRDAPLPKGTELRVMGPRRTRSFVPATSNGVFRRETCFGQGLRFDLRYGRTGGEDVDLFCRLERQGRRVGWVPDAWTSEVVPPHRCSVDYLERRAYAGGQAFAAIHVRNSRFPLLVAAKVRVVAVLKLLVSVVRARLMPPQSTADQRTQSTRRAAIRGKLSWREMMILYTGEKHGLQ